MKRSQDGGEVGSGAKRSQAGKARVAVVGCGSFGTAMARIVGASCAARPGQFDPLVRVWARRQSVVDEINERHTNSQYLGEDCLIPENVVATCDLREAVGEATFIILAVPHEYLGATLPSLASALGYDAAAGGGGDAACRPRCIVSLLKGLYWEGAGDGDVAGEGSIVPISNVIERDLRAAVAAASGGDASSGEQAVEVAVLMGPNIYTEMAKDEFAEATVGYSGTVFGDQLKELFTTEAFKVDLTHDRVGVELAGALKVREGGRRGREGKDERARVRGRVRCILVGGVHISHQVVSS